MRILVTGGAGYIGTDLVQQLNQLNEVDEIIVYDNLSNGNRNFFLGQQKLDASKIKFINGDILDSRKLNQVVQNVDTVYHLAANVTTPFSDQNPHLFEQVNHWGTAELVYAVEKSEVKRFIHLSSASVYGASEDICSLNDKPQPETFYGISKLRAEEHVKRLQNKKPETYILRCGNVYGYNRSMRFDAVINRFMFDANYKGRITVNGTGEQHRPFIHIKKVANALLGLCCKTNVSNGTYNLVDKNMAIGEVVEALRKMYPDLEMLFVNQHMKMRELKVKPSEEMRALFEKENGQSFADEMNAFKANFTF
jgi:UDP-glucose 4-epimerase